MIKKIFILLSLSLIAIPSYASNTLWEHYSKKGLSLPSVEARSTVYQNIAKDKYVGSYSQNVKLLSLLESQEPIGFSPSTGYSERLSESITAVDTEIPVSSVNDSDGIPLTCSSVNKCYFNIEQGTSKEERVVCSGLTSTSFTPCVRGLIATGNSETGSSTLAVPHNSGSRIIMTNIAQFYGNYLNLYDDQTKSAGVLTFTESPIVPIPTTNTQASNKLYVDTVGAGGFTSVNASTTKGLEVYGTAPETVGVNASSTSGLGFNSDGSLQIIASTTGGIKSDANGLYVDGSDNFSFAGETFMASTTFTASTSWQKLPEYTKDPATNNEATRKSYVDGLAVNAMLSAETAQASTTSSVYTGTSTISVATTRRAKLIEFDVTVMANMQSGGNSTKIEAKRIKYDLINQTIMGTQSTSAVSANELSCSDFTKTTAYDVIPNTSSVGSSYVLTASINGYGRFINATSSDTSIIFNYALSRTSTNNACIYFSSVIIYQ